MANALCVKCGIGAWYCQFVVMELLRAILDSHVHDLLLLQG